MSIYVIDYENTSVAGLNGIERLLDTDVVVVFFSAQTHRKSISRQLRKSKSPQQKPFSRKRM